MTIQDTHVVVARPEATIDELVQQIRESGTRQVRLFVPAENARLDLFGFIELMTRLGDPEIEITVVSPNPATVDAARVAQYAAVLSDAPARPAPPLAGADPRDLPTQPLPASEPPAPDQAVLEVLDRMPAADGAPEPPDADLRAAFDEFDDVLPPLPTARPAPRPAPAPPPLPDEDWNLPIPGTQPPPRPTRPLAAVAVARPADAPPAYEDEEPVAAARRWPAWLLPAVIMALLVAGVLGAGWYLTQRVTVQVAPPPSATTTRPLKNEPFPITQNPAQAAGAVVAFPVSADAEVTVQGQASKVRTPVGVARGTVTIINQLGQAIDLPPGTEFIAANPQGQEVHFYTDSPATIPPAVTTSTLTGSSTTYGQLEIAVSARSPGSASNVGENSIRAMVLPGQAPIPAGSLVFRNAPITGGSEEDVFIVTEADRQKALDAAIPLLYDAGVAKLRAQISNSELDVATVRPDAEALRAPAATEVATDPAVGAPAKDPNGGFTLTARARFDALATPAGRPVKAQLEQAARDVLAAGGKSPCKDGETFTPVITAYGWDGQQLTVDGSITCTPPGALAPDALARVRTAVRGQSHEAAEASLRQLQQQGVIGSFVLPPGDRPIPRFDFLIAVTEMPPQGPDLVPGAATPPVPTAPPSPQPTGQAGP
jgi:hypothetical protein